MILEICAFNIQSCFIAERAGASRIELCADALHGGTTRSIGLIKYALKHLNIPVFPMIRPRGGNFVYDVDEFAIMEQDVIACRKLGSPGIATGILLPDGRIDVERMKSIVELAGPMQVTCHKAFDATPDAQQALEDIITAGCARVLTSGLEKTALEGADLLAALVKQAMGRIIIMPGGSVRSSNLSQLRERTGAVEFHSSGLLSKGEGFIADEDEVGKMVGCLR
jgi:copper homeostasis protein